MVGKSGQQAREVDAHTIYSQKAEHALQFIQSIILYRGGDPTHNPRGRAYTINVINMISQRHSPRLTSV